MWKIISWIVRRDWILSMLLKRAMRDPYAHIANRNHTDIYMGRWWLVKKPWFSWLPQIRIHHIKEPDHDPALHNHPFDARTVILKGYYLEQTETGKEFRVEGETFDIPRNYFHRIVTVPEEGVWTLFFMWRRHGDWGFKVGTTVVPHKEHLG